MITIDEIREVAARVSLANTVVEKDYALGWLLWGISRHPTTNSDWVFKGGTCLKKCYFETYRFSEDLDFSYRGSGTPTAESLVQIFSEISDSIYEESGIEFPKASIKFEVFQNPRGSLSVQGGIKYRGPVRPNIGIKLMPRIKIDLTLDEPVVLPPVMKTVEHPYSDLPEGGISVLSYDYEEVFAEKVRALAQRLRPRDLYDVIHLYRRMDLQPNQQRVFSTLHEKCRTREMQVPTLEIIQTHDNRTLLESEWETQLRHQIPVLPDFQIFLEELPLALDWITKAKVVESKKYSALRTDEVELSVTNEAVQALTLPGEASSFLDKVRFAAANRLVVKLGYDNSFREIEPYSFARSSEGNLLLRTVRVDSREDRTYRWDRVENIEVLSKTFTPSYQVEITSAGYLPVHQLTKKESTPRSTFRGRRTSSSRSSGPTYVYRCSVCGKTSRKKKMSSNLNPHKRKGSNYQCPGRTGIYVKTVY